VHLVDIISFFYLFLAQAQQKNNGQLFDHPGNVPDFDAFFQDLFRSFHQGLNTR
jgi:hypothetical protein